MSSNTFDLLLFSGAIHGILFNVVTLAYAARKKITKAILYLNGVVLSISLNNIQAWLIAQEVELPGFFLKHLEIPWYFFVVPLFYLFVLHFLQINAANERVAKTLLAIFITEVLIRAFLIAYCYNGTASISIIEYYRQIEEGINALIALYFLYRSYQIVFKHNTAAAYVRSFDSLAWLRNFMRIGFVVFLLWILAIVLNQYYSSVKMYYPLRLSSTVMIYWVGYQGLIRYAVLKDRIQLRIKIRQKPIKSKVDSQYNTQDTALQTVENCIAQEAFFLNPQLGIQDVADNLNISVSKLSKLISTHSQYHFVDLVNKHRVQYARALLQNKEFNRYTIEAIGLESGFNSKSAFYTAFNKVYAQTPAAYRQAKNS